MAIDFRTFIARIEPDALEQYVHSIDKKAVSQIDWSVGVDRQLAQIRTHFPSHPKI